ncbi:MAG: hypothetical protein QNJ30_25930 [Kiloniellales bacterium]|nr:hypothetical protein [Kiloniellales bacterium]
MKHRIILTVGIGSGALIWLFGLANGYFADPAPLPFGIFYPFLLLSIAAISVSVSIGYCVRLIFVRKTKRNVALAKQAESHRMPQGYECFYLSLAVRFHDWTVVPMRAAGLKLDSSAARPCYCFSAKSWGRREGADWDCR